ncbi:hypothetical protein ACIA5C_47555 [Actinoplanes sp. NPDC051343]
MARAMALRDHDDPAAAFAHYEGRRRAGTEQTVTARARLSAR